MTLSEFRKSKKLTQHEMSELIEVSFSHYSKIELGVRNPSYNFITLFKRKFPDGDIQDMFF